MPPASRSRSWWPAIQAASCLAYFALLITSDLRRPEPFGLIARFDAAGMQVAEVERGAPADRAGLLAGDRVLAIGAVTVRRRIDLLAADTHLQTNRPVTISIDRGGARRTATLVAGRAPWRYWTRREGAALLTVRGVQLITLMLASVLLIKRPHDRHARLGAWLLATLGVFSITLPYGIAETWRALPAPIGAVLFLVYVMSVAIGAVAFTFFASFPRPVIRGAGAWAAVWTPMAAVLSWHVWYGWHLIYAPERVHLVPDWSFALVAVSIGYGLALVAAIAAGYRALGDVNDRRRLKVLLAGSLVGCLSGGPVAALYWIGPGKGSPGPVFASPLASVGSLGFLAMPLSFAYAILRHRLFDVGLIVRRGLQYALARRVLVSVVPALAILLAIDLLIHGDRPLVETLNARGPIYVVIALVAVAAHSRREAWLDALDRRFFRERYNAQQILRRIVEDIRTGDAISSIAGGVVKQIEAALHPSFAAILGRSRGGHTFECVAIWPATRLIEPLDEAMRLVALLGVLRRPAEVSRTESAWIRRELPHAEDAYLARNGIEFIVPAGSDALLALGAKQSEEPYSGEDADLLAAIGEALALRLAQDQRSEAAAARAFEECSECGAVFDTGTGVCVHDGAALRPTPVPRVLANRYRLDRRLGRGGMGAVYEAVDSALGRRVAAKVMRDDALRSGDAAERFQREAQHAASLAHPNVVTVYDFGVFASRAFLVMELLEGTTLRDAMHATQAMPPRRVVEILRGVCAAVDAAHSVHLVHRDLKPENVFLSLTPYGEVVKVLDFGVAKTLAPTADWTSAPAMKTADGVLLGTLPYMAPEQLRGEAVSGASDLWAIAIMAHEMLYGRHPFAGAGPLGWHAASAAQSATDPLAQFFGRALAADPVARHPSAVRLLEDLEEAIGRS